MKIRLKNLGALQQASFSLGELTIICGKNNTGKTYATYALFGFLSFWRETFSIRVPEKFLEKLFSEGTVTINIDEYTKDVASILKKGCEAYTQMLPKIFASTFSSDKSASDVMSPLPMSSSRDFSIIIL